MLDASIPNSSILPTSNKEVLVSVFPNMETEAQGSDDFSDDSLGILETRRIISNLKWVKTNSLKQTHSTAAPLTFGTGSFFAGRVGRSYVYRMLSSIPGLHPPDSNRTHPHQVTTTKTCLQS